MQGSGFLSILSDPGECRVQASLKAGRESESQQGNRSRAGLTDAKMSIFGKKTEPI